MTQLKEARKRSMETHPTKRVVRATYHGEKMCIL